MCKGANVAEAVTRDSTLLCMGWKKTGLVQCCLYFCLRVCRLTPELYAGIAWWKGTRRGPKQSQEAR